MRLPSAVDYEQRDLGRRAERRMSRDESAQWTRAHLDGLKVLVVDDEPDARESLKRMLEDGNADVMTAASADDGLQAIRSQRSDVLVSDIGMAGMDGYEFLRRVRALDTEESRKDSGDRADGIRPLRGPHQSAARGLPRARCQTCGPQ